MGVMDGNPKNEPMHYGEVIGVWAFISANNGLISAYEAFVNHVGDEDLKKLLQKAVEKKKAEKEDFEELLKDNGIALPPPLPERPVANAEEIPVGARFTDPEIAAKLSMDVGKAMVSISEVLGQCIREDIATMFAQCLSEKVKFGAEVLRMNKEKGWVIIPPLHLPNGKKE